MGKCPECGNTLHWSSDYDDIYEEDVFYSSWCCVECDIEVIKRYDVTETEGE